MPLPFHVRKVKLSSTLVIPVSTTATTIPEFAPGLMSQAFGMSIAWKFHCSSAKPGSFGVEVARYK